MNYTLVHKNVDVAELSISEYSGGIEKIDKVINQEHLPIGVTIPAGSNKGMADRKLLEDWWVSRSIPASRDGIQQILFELDLKTSTALALKSYGLSLSDHYWVRPKNSNLSWSDINFFENDFSKDVGEILFGQEVENSQNISLMSPDNTSDGWLKKKWIIEDGKRVLAKGGSSPFKQEPFNEVVATALMERLGINHIPYRLSRNHKDNEIYSLCETFVTSSTELIPAWRVISAFRRDNKHSAYNHLLHCCNELGIPNIRQELDKMLTLDYIIYNTDRHYNNFGFLRDPDTLKWIGFAPVFDSGTSLWHNEIVIGRKQESKPFKKNHDDQMKLVDSLSWFDIGRLKDFEEECVSILKLSEHLDEGRIEKIADVIMSRAKQVERIRQNKVEAQKDMPQPKAEQRPKPKTR